jgi:hypothetical protein
MNSIFDSVNAVPNLNEHLQKPRVKFYNSGFIDFYVMILSIPEANIGEYENFWLEYPFQHFLMICDGYFENLATRDVHFTTMKLEHLHHMVLIHKYHYGGQEIPSFLFDQISVRLYNLSVQRPDLLLRSKIITLPAMAMILHYTLKEWKPSKARSIFDAIFIALRLHTGHTAAQISSLRADQVVVTVDQVQPFKVTIQIFFGNETTTIYEYSGNPIDPSRYLSMLNLVWNCIHWYSSPNTTLSEKVAEWQSRPESDMFFDPLHHSQATAGKKSAWCQKCKPRAQLVTDAELNFMNVKESVVVNEYTLLQGNEGVIRIFVTDYLQTTRKVSSRKVILAGIRTARDAFYATDPQLGLVFLDANTTVNNFYGLSISDPDGFADKTLTELLQPLGLSYRNLNPIEI